MSNNQMSVVMDKNISFKAVLCTLPTESPDAFLISPRVPSKAGPNRMIKMAIIALIKWMEKQGYTRDEYDYFDIDTLLPTDAELEAYFRKINPQIVGLSATVSTSYMQVKRVAQIIRNTCPDCWVVVGGTLASSSNVVLAKTETDICVSGDGELPWVALLSYVKRNGRQWKFEELSQIRGLVYHNENGELHFTGHPGKIPDGDLVLPDYDILEMGLQGQTDKLMCYFGKGAGDFFMSVDPRSHDPRRRPNLAMLATSKGCVAKCTFCQRSFKGYRTVAIERLEDHLRMLQEKFDVGFVHFSDENFGSDREFAYDVAGLMKKYDILWSGGGTRVSSVKPEDVAFYKAHNCMGFTFGVESGSQRILDVMEKRFTVDTIKKTLELCIEQDMNAPLNFMTGMPGETEQTSIESGRLIGELAYKMGIHPQYTGFTVNYAMPFPGTPLYEYCQQLGLIGTSVEEEEAFLIRIGRGRINRFNYLNTNGAPAKEAIFWSDLVGLEASRTYRELEKKAPRQPGRLGATLKARTQSQIDRLMSGGSFLMKLRRNLLFNFSNNPVLDALPRWIAYPLAKNLLYADHLAKRFAFKFIGRIYTFGSEKNIPARLPDSYFNDGASREHSLRFIVQKNRHELKTNTEKALFALRSSI